MPSKNTSVKDIIYIFVSALIICLVLAHDIVEADGHYRYLMREGLPESGIATFARSALLAISALLLSSSLLRQHRKREPSETAYPTSTIVAVVCLTTISAGASILSCLRPEIFSDLVAEDNIIENLSAAFYFIACIFCGNASYRYIRAKQPLLNSLCIGLMGCAFFIMGMEEISWMQRILEIEVSGALLRNKQNELNLHNIETNISENIYYFGSFVFLCLLPLLRKYLSQIKPLQSLSQTLPSINILICSLAFCTCNSDMWNISHIQFACYFTVSTIFLLIFSASTNGQRWALFYCLLVAILSQALFLYSADKTLRLWDATEFKEMLIPISFLFYSIECSRNSPSKSHLKLPSARV